jgi:CHASE1-domain containing sensor protein
MDTSLESRIFESILSFTAAYLAQGSQADAARERIRNLAAARIGALLSEADTHPQRIDGTAATLATSP